MKQGICKYQDIVYPQTRIKTTHIKYINLWKRKKQRKSYRRKLNA